jgi:hypothetical protein
MMGSLFTEHACYENESIIVWFVSLLIYSTRITCIEALGCVRRVNGWRSEHSSRSL